VLAKRLGWEDEGLMDHARYVLFIPSPASYTRYRWSFFEGASSSSPRQFSKTIHLRRTAVSTTTFRFFGDLRPTRARRFQLCFSQRCGCLA